MLKMRKYTELESKHWCASKPQIDHLNISTEHAQRLSQSQQGVKPKSAVKLWNWKWRLFFSAKLKGNKKQMLAKLKTMHNVVITLGNIGD